MVLTLAPGAVSAQERSDRETADGLRITRREFAADSTHPSAQGSRKIATGLMSVAPNVGQLTFPDPPRSR